MEKREAGMLSTGQAARLCSVTPDTIRKWIKSGRLQAVRTAGGHHRLELHELAPFVSQPLGSEDCPAPTPGCPPMPLRCWEYLADQEEARHECESCVVYRIRAAWCFEVADLAADIGHAREFCSESCQDCLYYQRLHAGVTKVLVLCADPARVLAPDKGNGLELRFASNAYEASCVVGDFRPAFVVIEDEFLSAMGQGLLEGLSHDPRVAGVKLIRAVPLGKKGRKNGARSALFDGEIEKPFTPRQLKAIVDGFPVEAPVRTAKAAPGADGFVRPCGG